MSEELIEPAAGPAQTSALVAEPGRRRPWLAVVAGVLTLPLGYTYAGRPLRGVVAYFLVVLLGGCALVLATRATEQWLALSLLGLLCALPLAFAVDTYVVAKRANPYRLRPFNRWYAYLGIVLVLSFADLPAGPLIKSLVRANRFPSGSMMPTLLAGDHIMSDMLVYRTRTPDRLDIVLFDYPEDPSKQFVKRIVGIPGDTIEIRERQVYINDSPLAEPYVQYVATATKRRNANQRDNFAPLTLADGQYFVLGDNRDRSHDSRYWGTVPEENIKGRVGIIYWSWDDTEGRVRWSRTGAVVR